MKEKRCLIDTFTGRIYLVGPGGYELKLSPGSIQYDLVESSAGHLMLPCSRFDVRKTPREEVSSYIVGDFFNSSSSSSTAERSNGGPSPTDNASDLDRLD